MLTHDGLRRWTTPGTGSRPRERLRVPLLLTIQFADHLPADRLREIIASRRAAHARRLAEYRAAEKLPAGLIEG